MIRHLGSEGASGGRRWAGGIAMIERMRSRPYTRAELERMDIDALDRLAFGYAGGDVVSIAPGKIQIQYPDDLENAEHQRELQGDEWAGKVDLSEPVDVSIQTDGVLRLEDGHHRWLAACLSKRNLVARIDIKGKPIEVILARQAQAQAKRPRP